MMSTIIHTDLYVQLLQAILAKYCLTNLILESTKQMHNNKSATSVSITRCWQMSCHMTFCYSNTFLSKFPFLQVFLFS